MQIVIGNPVNFPVDQLLADFFHFFGWNTGVNTARFTNRAFQQHSPCSNDGIAVYDCIIHHNGTHPDQYIIMNSATMHNRIVANGNIVPNVDFCFLKSSVQDRTILDIDFVPDTNTVYIAAYNCIKPNTALITHDYITHNSSIWGNKAILAELWVNSVDMKNNWHAAK